MGILPLCGDLEVTVGFVKTSVSVTTPKVVEGMALSTEGGDAPEIGEIRDGFMWCGDKWVPAPEESSAPDPDPDPDGDGDGEASDDPR